MSDGEQIGFDLGVEVAGQSVIPPGPPEWVRWYRQMDEQLAVFTTETIPDLPQPFWSDSAMDRVETVFVDFLPNEDSVTDPANYGIADQFIRWVGECFVRRYGWQWCYVPDGGGLYPNFGPALRGFDEDPDPLYIVSLVKAATHDDFGEIRDRFAD